MESPGHSRGRLVWLLLRFAIAAIALYLVSKQVDWRQAKSILAASDLKYVLAAVLLFSLVLVLGAVRWRILLEVQGIHLSLWVAMRLTYVGHLLSFFMIGTTSGDLVKAYLLGNYTDRKTEGFVSVFFDRLVGLAVLVVFALVVALFLMSDPHVAGRIKPIAALLAVMAVGGMVILSRRIRRWIRLEKLLRRLPLGRLLEQADQALLAYRLAGWSILKAAVATLLLQVLASVAGFFLGKALGFGDQATIWYFLLYVPLAFLVGSIPVSIFWGLGLLEGAYVALFSGGGLTTATQAAMLAMAVRLLQLFWALPGVPVLLMGVRLGRRDLSREYQ